MPTNWELRSIRLIHQRLYPSDAYVISKRRGRFSDSMRPGRYPSDDARITSQTQRSSRSSARLICPACRCNVDGPASVTVMSSSWPLVLMHRITIATPAAGTKVLCSCLPLPCSMHETVPEFTAFASISSAERHTLAGWFTAKRHDRYFTDIHINNSDNNDNNNNYNNNNNILISISP